MAHGQSILITGATSGIGREAALRLVRAGHLVLAGGRRPDALAALARDSGGRVEPLVLDVTDPGSVTSRTSGSTRPPEFRARAARASARRPPARITCPAPARRRAASRPMPEVAPVIRMLRPARMRTMLS